MKKMALFTFCFTLFTCQHALAAPSWSLDVRADMAIPTSDFADDDLSAGFGGELTASYFFMEHLALYLGWGWHHFSTDTSAHGDWDIEETGYRFGLLFEHPLNDLPVHYQLSIGGIYNHLEVDADNGSFSSDSGHGFGTEFGAGLVIPLTDSLSLMPSIRYHLLSRELDLAGVEQEVDLDYLSLGASLLWRF